MLRGHQIWAALLLLGLVFLAYWPAFHGSFIWDDVTFISDSDLIHAPNGLFNIWFSRQSTDYWPLTYTIFWFLWRIFSSATLGYHLLNVVVHALNALLIWKILSRLGWRWAYAVALLFALHPVNVEAVAWIFQLKTTLAFTLVLSATLFWLRFYAGERRAYAVAFVLFLLALLTKASVVTWPLVLLGLAWWQKRQLARRDVMLVAPFMLASLVIGWLGIFWYPYDQLLGGEKIRVESFFERLLSAGHAFWFYVYRAIVPLNLTFIYPRWQVSTVNPLDYLPLIALIAVFALRAPRPALAYFFLTIFPVLGFVDIYFMRYSYVADHWQYMAILGIIGLFAWTVDTVFANKKLKLLVFLPVPFLAFLTWKQAGIYQNEETIWRDTLKKNPTAWIADNNLGVILLQTGRGAESLPHFQTVMQEKPDYVDPYLNSGVYFLGQGDEATALQYFTKALEVFPYNARALNNLAAIALRNNDPEAAIRDLKVAVEHLPTYVTGYRNLGLLYSRLGRAAEAEASFRQVLAIRPDDEAAKKYLEGVSR